MVDWKAPVFSVFLRLHHPTDAWIIRGADDLGPYGFIWRKDTFFKGNGGVGDRKTYRCGKMPVRGFGTCGIVSWSFRYINGSMVRDRQNAPGIRAVAYDFTSLPENGEHNLAPSLIICFIAVVGEQSIVCPRRGKILALERYIRVRCVADRCI